MIGEITNHLWQTTAFAVLVGLLVNAFRKNRAHVRYAMWLAASLKFLMPFSLLVALGSRLWQSLTAARTIFPVPPSAVSHAIVHLTQPFSEASAPARSAISTNAANWILLAALLLWIFGFLVVVSVQLRSWFRVRAALRASEPLNIAANIPVRSSPNTLELAVVGFVRHVVLLPEGIAQSLTCSQLQAVLAHEECHARRLDNLTAAIHSVVEALFWFHPLVWWIGAKLVEERERSCDEAVLSAGSEPQDYARGILVVCKSYVQSPLRWVSGVTGSDLKTRIRSILSGEIADDLNFSRKAALAAASALTLVAPVLVGAIANPAALRSPSAVMVQNPDEAKFAAFVPVVVSIKRSHLNTNFDSWGMPLGSDTWSARNTTLLMLLRETYSLGHGTEDHRVVGGPDWLASDRYDIDAKVDPSSVAAFQKLTPEERTSAIHRLLLAILTDRCKLAVHRDTKELPIYDLVVARGGPKLKPASQDELTPSTDPNADPRRGAGVWMQGQTLIGRAVDMRDLAGMLQYLLSRTVVDKTGLAGKYTFTLRWERDENASSEDAEDSFLGAFPPQLGLKLQSAKGPVEVIVIDRLEKPSEN
jgi:bla regulator protein BlaR1